MSFLYFFCKKCLPRDALEGGTEAALLGIARFALAGAASSSAHVRLAEVRKRTASPAAGRWQVGFGGKWVDFDGASAEKATQLDKGANFGLNWAGSAFEHIWHVLLGQPARMEKHCNPCSRGGANRHGMSASNASGPFHCCATTRENCPQSTSHRPAHSHRRYFLLNN